MIRRPPRSTRTDTLFPYTTRFRSHLLQSVECGAFAIDVVPGGHGRDNRPIGSWKFLAHITRRACAGIAGHHRGRRLQRVRNQPRAIDAARSEEHTSELQSLMRNSYAVFCLTKQNNTESNHILINNEPNEHTITTD